jgi:hypothetical protein
MAAIDNEKRSDCTLSRIGSTGLHNSTNAKDAIVRRAIARAPKDLADTPMLAPTILGCSNKSHLMLVNQSNKNCQVMLFSVFEQRLNADSVITLMEVSIEMVHSIINKESQKTGPKNQR